MQFSIDSEEIQSVFSSHCSQLTSETGSVASLEGSSESLQSVVPKAKKSRSGVRCRSWVFTVFGQLLLDAGLDYRRYKQLVPGTAVYIVLGYEFSRSGSSHIQGYVRFPNPRAFGSVKAIIAGQLPSAFVEQCHDIDAAITYCKKGGSWEEFGGAPRSYTSGEELSKGVVRKRKLYADLAGGKNPLDLIAEQPEEVGFIHSIAKYAAHNRIRDCPAQVLYLWGPTGVGKTTSTEYILQGLDIGYYKKPPGDRWFDGYNFQRVIIFDEFTGSVPLHQWNGLCDPSPPLLEVKGAKLPNSASHYIVLSNRSAEEQYPQVKDDKPEEWRAYRRRIQSCHHVGGGYNGLQGAALPSDDATLAAIRADISMIVSVFVSDLVIENC